MSTVTPAPPTIQLIETATDSIVQLSLALHPSKQTVNVKLHPPNTADQECPILQEPISTIMFDAFPRPFKIDHPTHTAITLEKCSHTFHAMALIYHWARSGKVLCPVCRDGPKGQRLSIRQLPKEWRYSLAARIRRQKQKDREEAEEDDRQTAMLMVSHQRHPTPIILSISPMYVEIRIEVLSQINLNDLDTLLPLTWTVQCSPTRIHDSIVFSVPTDELQHIPYPLGTLIRLVPRTNQLLQPLQPSHWFATGSNTYPGSNFNVRADELGFGHIHYTMSDVAYEEMILDAFMAYDILVAVPNMP